MSYCFRHERAEPIDAAPWRICFGCGHVFPGPSSAVQDWNAAFPGALVVQAGQVKRCPHCLHAWV